MDKRVHFEYPACVIREAVLLGPIGHLLHQATLPRQGVIAALHNTQKQTQGGCQNEETKKHGPNERIEQNSRKRTKQNEDKLYIRCKFKTLVIRMLKELSEDLKSIKKDLLRNKGYTD